MKIISLLSALLTGLIFTTLSLAETTYRYPSDLTEKEHLVMMGSQGTYTECLNKESTAIIDKYEDFRKVADAAMETCKTTLTIIDKDLEKMNLDPDFRRFFLRKISRNSAKNLLPNLMMTKSK